MQEVICQKIERIGSITLNRPEALNALTYGMISKIEETLESVSYTHLTLPTNREV